MNATWRAKKFDAVLPIVSQAYPEFAEPSKISIENFVGFVRVLVAPRSSSSPAPERLCCLRDRFQAY
jgi:hypothetical protein